MPEHQTLTRQRGDERANPANPRLSGSGLRSTAHGLGTNVSMPRRSVHIEPHGTVAIARHYIRDLAALTTAGLVHRLVGRRMTS